MAENIALAERNPHERDSHISFQDEGHIYTIDGETDFMSVTTWNHRHFKPFDADRIIAGMMSRDSWERSRYFGQTPEQIKAMTGQMGNQWSGPTQEGAEGDDKEDLDTIKRQLAELQAKLNKMGK